MSLVLFPTTGEKKMVAVWVRLDSVLVPTSRFSWCFFFWWFFGLESPPLFLLDRSLQKRSRRELAKNQRKAARSGKGRNCPRCRDSWYYIGWLDAGATEKKVGQRDLNVWFVTLTLRWQAASFLQVPGPRGGLWFVRAQTSCLLEPLLGLRDNYQWGTVQYGLVGFSYRQACHAASFPDPCSTHPPPFFFSNLAFCGRGISYFPT